MTLRKIGLILTTALLLLSGSGCALFQSKKQSAPAPEAQAAVTEVQKAFDAFLMEETRRQLTQDGLTLHFSLTDPSALGIQDVPTTLGSLSEASEIENKQAMEAVLNSLIRIPLLPFSS